MLPWLQGVPLSPSGSPLLSYRPLATGTAIARSDVRILIIVLVKKPGDLLSQGARVEQLAHAPCAIKELPLELSWKCIPLHN
jgi:hypothetical protein